MRLNPYFCIFGVLLTVIHAYQLNPDPSFLGWSPKCTACVPVEMLRSSAFGLELSPNHLSLAVQFPNATLAPLLKVKPSFEFEELMLRWMTEKEDHMCLNTNLGVDALFRRETEIEIIMEALQQLLVDELETFYPALDFDYGGIAIPDNVFRNPNSYGIIEEAVERNGMRNEKNRHLFQFYPTDFTMTAATVLEGLAFSWSDESISTPAGDKFQALVITDSNSHFSVSWYRFSFVQFPLGQITQSKLDSTAVPDMSRLKAFVSEREELFTKDKLSPGKRKDGFARVILRLDANPNNDAHNLGKDLLAILKGTQFDPMSVNTTIYRGSSDNSMWTPAFYVAYDTKERVDSGIPHGCQDEHPACRELRECVKQEARGELVICDDVVPPNSTFIEIVEASVQKGSWWVFEDSFAPLISNLSNEAEARAWVSYCTHFSSLTPSKCEEVIVQISDDRQGVLSSDVGFIYSVIYATGGYWLDSSAAWPMLSVSVYWFGTENLLKLACWTVSKVLGKELYEMGAGMFIDLWSMDLKSIFEELGDSSPKGETRETLGAESKIP